MDSIGKFVLALMAVAAVCLCAIPAICEEIDGMGFTDEEEFSTDDGLTYMIIDDTDTVSLIGYTDDFDPSKGLTIPSTVSHSGAEYKVCSIGEKAFYYCPGLKGTLEIPGSVTTIGEKAFYYCYELTGTLEIPGSVTTIGEYAFGGCNGLSGLVLNEGLEKIGEGAFYYCPGLKGTLDMPGSVTTIGEKAFGDCNGLSGLVLNEGLTKIGDYAFDFCASLTGTLEIPKSVVVIGICAFNYCVKLSGLVLNEGLISIGESAFKNCKELTGVLKIPGSVESIGEGAFNYCGKLSGLVLNEGLISIGESAFENCNGLTGVLKIPGSVESIGKYAFDGTKFSYIEVNPFNENYTSLDGVLFNKDRTTLVCFPGGKESSSYTIPNGVVNINEYAFYDCQGLTGTITIPGSVKVIGMGAFEDCKGLTGVLKIPGSVESIGDGAFYGCKGITAVYMDGDVSGISEYAFDDWTFYDTDGVTEITDMKSLPGWRYYGTTDNMVRMSPIVKTTIDFDADGGSTQVNPIVAVVGDSIFIPDYDGVKSGHTFGGWSLDGTVYMPGEVYNVLGPATFKAVWKENHTTTDNTMLIIGAVAAVIAAIAISAVILYKRRP